MKTQKDMDEEVAAKQKTISKLLDLNGINNSYVTGGALMNVAITMLRYNSNDEEVIRILELHAHRIKHP